MSFQMLSERCRVVPLPNHQVGFEIDGEQRLTWHFGPEYPRPFFFPAIGPAGHSLTRVGHPGAPNHDHHRSIWYAHAKVMGVDFWSDNTPARIEQKRWLAYRDGKDAAMMAVELNWLDGHDPTPLLRQELVVSVAPLKEGELTIELQSTFVSSADSLEFQKTNFGFLAVRVAKSISAHFGSGRITNSEGKQDEPAIFGQPAKWVDYSGPVGATSRQPQVMPINGITYFDHPQNPGHPSRWHVREDGWMGASSCYSGPLKSSKKSPLQVRHLLHLHDGQVDPQVATRIAAKFAQRQPWKVVAAKVKHESYRIVRIK